MAYSVEDIVRERIEQARHKAEERKRRRAELAAARRRGLAARHARKLRGAEDHAGMGQRPTTVGQSPKIQADRGDTPTVERDSVSLSPVTETVTTELDRVDTNTVAADSVSAADEGQL